MPPVLSVRFYRSANGNEPVRVWLQEEVSAEARKAIGGDIRTVQLGWPIGMPVVRKMEKQLWEVRSTIPEGIARVMFTTQASDMVLLHGFIKKSDKTPQNELEIAQRRRDEVKNGE